LGENVKIKVAGRRCRPQLPGFFRPSSSNGTRTTSRIGAGFSCAGGLGPKVEDALGRDLVVDVGNDLERISAAFAHERVGGINAPDQFRRSAPEGRAFCALLP